MAYADPQTVTINAVANSLPRISSDKNSGAFRKDDSNVALTVQHQFLKSRVRHTARIDYRKIAADPLIAAQNLQYSMSAYVVFDVPLIGYTIAEQKLNVDALSLWLTASSGANTTKLLGSEN